jgi:hypothetical protein
MIRGGFLDAEDRRRLIALARDGSAASVRSSPTRRSVSCANTFSQLGAPPRFGHRQLLRHLAQEFSGHDVNGVKSLAGRAEPSLRRSSQRGPERLFAYFRSLWQILAKSRGCGEFCCSLTQRKRTAEVEATLIQAQVTTRTAFRIEALRCSPATGRAGQCRRLLSVDAQGARSAGRGAESAPAVGLPGP